MGTEKPVYSFRLNKELAEALKALAAQQNRTLSNLVETILLQYVNDHKETTDLSFSKVSRFLYSGATPTPFHAAIADGRQPPNSAPL